MSRTSLKHQKQGVPISHGGHGPGSPLTDAINDILQVKGLPKNVKNIFVRIAARRAISKADSALDKLREGYEKEHATANGAKKEEIIKKLQTVEEIKKLHEEEIELFARWVRGSLGKKSFDPDVVSDYWRRLRAAQEYQSSRDNIERITRSKGAKTLGLGSDLNLLPPSVKHELEELQRLEQKEGITYHIVLDHNTREFVQAYSVLRANFPPDELDPAVDLMKMLDDNTARYPQLATTEFERHAPALQEPIHLRYYLIVAKDKTGNIIGVSDGNFIGTKKTSSLYWAHIAVPSEMRRKGYASLLYATTLSLGNKYSHDAEKTLGAKYETPIPGNKLMYYVVESEPANLESEEKVRQTFGRLLFHGKTSGLAFIPSLRYAQVDLEYDAKSRFDKKGWNAVPLLLLIRRLGKEEETKLTVKEIREIAQILPTYFFASGLYNPNGIKFDLDYATSGIQDLAPNALEQIVLLPNANNIAEVLAQLEWFVKTYGTIDVFVQDGYPNHLWTKEYLERFNRAQQAGEVFTLERAIRFMHDLERRKIDTTPSSA